MEKLQGRALIHNSGVCEGFETFQRSAVRASEVDENMVCGRKEKKTMMNTEIKVVEDKRMTYKEMPTRNVYRVRQERKYKE